MWVPSRSGVFLLGGVDCWTKIIKLVCWRKWSKIDLTTLLLNGQDAKITQFFKRILKYEVVW